MNAIDPMIREMGKSAADAVAGAGTFRDVRVETDEDNASRPVYRFSFLLNSNSRLSVRPGPIRIRLIQRLLDELASRRDEHLPTIRILSHADWDQETRAQSH